MNLDIPFKLYPMAGRQDKTDLADVYVTEDEQWIILKRTIGWTVAHSISGNPRDVPSITSAICEIKERLTGRPYHRHNPEAVLGRIRDHQDTG